MSIALSKAVGILVAILVVVAAIGGYFALVSSQQPREVATVRTVTEKITEGGTITATQVVTTTATQKVDQAVFLQNWTPSGTYAPVWYGMNKGLFLQQGIQLTIASTTGSGDVVKKLDLGLGQFGVADAGTWIKSSLSGSKSKAIGVYTVKNEALIIYNKKKVTAPKDLEGKTIGSTSGSAAEIQLPIFAEKAGIDLSKMKIVTTTTTALYSLLGEGQFDGVLTTLGGVTTAKNIAKEKGFEIGVFSFHEFGIETISFTLLAREDVIKDNPDVVRRFLKAYFASYKYAIEKPEEAVRIVIDLNPGLNYNNELEKFGSLISWNNPATLFQTKPIGKIDDQLMKQTVANVAKMFKLQLPSEDYYKTVYTNDFLPNSLE